jgi:hypothetical protein
LKVRLRLRVGLRVGLGLRVAVAKAARTRHHLVGAIPEVNSDEEKKDSDGKEDPVGDLFASNPGARGSIHCITVLDAVEECKVDRRNDDHNDREDCKSCCCPNRHFEDVEDGKTSKKSFRVFFVCFLTLKSSYFSPGRYFTGTDFALKTSE